MVKKPDSTLTLVQPAKQELAISRRHFLTKSTTKGALMMLAARSGLLLGGASLIPKLNKVQAHPAIIALGRFLLRRAAIALARMAVRWVARKVVDYVANLGNNNNYGNIQRVTQQVSASGYTQVHPETYIMSGTEQNPNSYAYVAGHQNGVDCCIVIVDGRGSNPIYMNGAVAAAFAHISDNWSAFIAQSSHINVDINSALVPISPSAQQSLRSGFNYNYPATKVYPTRIGSVRINYNVINHAQGRLDVHIYYGSQSIYWDSFVIDFS